VNDPESSLQFESALRAPQPPFPKGLGRAYARARQQRPAFSCDAQRYGISTPARASGSQRVAGPRTGGARILHR